MNTLKTTFLVTILHISLIGNLSAITAVNHGNWSDPNTWNCNCIPTSTDNVNLNQFNTVVDIDFTVKSISNSGFSTFSFLDIVSSATLTVDGSSLYGISWARVTNQGTLNVLNTTDTGLYSVGIVNTGDMHIGPNVGNDGIYIYCCNSHFDVLNDGVINMTDIGRYGINTIQESEITNNGDMNFVDVANHAIFIDTGNNTNNPNIFNNNAGGTISIDQSKGVLIQNATVGGNYGIINLNNVIGAGLSISGLWNNGFPMWDNESTGEINCNDITSAAINVGSGENFTNYGSINLNDNIVTGLSGGGLKVNEGEITGNARALTGSNFTNKGLISPGVGSNMDTLEFYVTNFNIFTLDPVSSVLQINIEDAGSAGLNYDQIVFKDDPTYLAGNLNVVLDSNYTPQVGDCFEIIKSEHSINQIFDQINLPSVSPLEWELSYNPNDVQICVTCRDTIFVATDPIPDGVYQAEKLVYSDKTVPANGNVEFWAEEEILLQSGFETIISAVFQAIIATCN